MPIGAERLTDGFVPWYSGRLTRSQTGGQVQPIVLLSLQEGTERRHQRSPGRKEVLPYRSVGAYFMYVTRKLGNRDDLGNLTSIKS